MEVIHSVHKLPTKPAVYAMYGLDSDQAAYVGIGDNLKRRLIQHLVRRNSSVATGTSIVGLNPDYVTEVRWWEHSKFDDRNDLLAAELMAFEILEPNLRSRGKIPQAAREISENEEFKEEMRRLLKGQPDGKLILPTLEGIVKRIEELERRVEKIEKKLA